jgi:adenylate kinase
MALNVVMLGPPASGKGTQAFRLAEARRIPKISTGDILREAAQTGSELGLHAKALMDRGELLGDAEMISIVRDRLNRPDAKEGFILDGFPRTVSQAEALDRMLQEEPLVIIDLAVPAGELIHRMQDRRVCSKCGTNAEPGAEATATCSRCGGKMIMRADDGDERVRQHRLDVYARESKPLLDYYRGRPTFRSINGAQSPDRVAKDLSASIDAMMPGPTGRERKAASGAGRRAASSERRGAGPRAPASKQ